MPRIPTAGANLGVGGPAGLPNLFNDPGAIAATLPSAPSGAHVHPLDISPAHPHSVLPMLGASLQNAPQQYAALPDLPGPKPTPIKDTGYPARIPKDPTQAHDMVAKILTDKGWNPVNADQMGYLASAYGGVKTDRAIKAIEGAQQASIAPTGIAGKAAQLATEGGQTLAGIGPGVGLSLYHTGEDLKNATQGDFSFKHTRALGSLIEKSYAESIHHPGRQWQQDPLSLLMNASTPFFFGAGAAARGVELAAAPELAAEAGTSTARQVAKTLLRPQPQTRKLTLRAGETTGPNPLTVEPTAYKSALGGYIQKFLDPRLERRVAEPHLAGGAVNRITGQLRIPANLLAAGARMGRKFREDLETEIRTRSGELSASNIPAELHGNVARGMSFVPRWRGLYDSGVDYAEMMQHPNRDWTAIREPPSDIPSSISPQALTSHPILNLTERQLSNQFVPGRGRMIPGASEVETKGAQFKYVPTEVIKGMRTWGGPGEGALANVGAAIDAGNQIVRTGRYMNPAYAQWAAQNGLLHATQAGAWMGRNIWQLHSQLPRTSPAFKAAFDGALGKGVARASTGETGRFLEGSGRAGALYRNLQHFWHIANDQWARRLAGIHELNHAGYHTAESWENLWRTNPTEFRKIVGGSAAHEAIDYSEMTPGERASLQKLMTAYGWTRGATTYTARYALQHPVQARVGAAQSQQAQQVIENFYKQHGGMVPEWLRERLPIGGNKLLDTAWVAPSGTPATLISELPGATIGQTENLQGEAGPVTGGIMGLITGQNRYGTAYRGGERFTGPIKDVLNRFKPWGELQTLASAKQGGTFKQGAGSAIASAVGYPVQTLRDPTKTAGLAEKDYEAALSIPDKVKFQYNRKLELLPQEIAQYEKAAGQQISPQDLSRLKADFDAVEQRDLFQYHYAQQHGSKAWKSLPPMNKLAGTLDWLAHHGYSQATVEGIRQAALQAHNDKEIEQAVSTLWSNTGIGQADSMWHNMVKRLTPPKLTPPNP